MLNQLLSELDFEHVTCDLIPNVVDICIVSDRTYFIKIKSNADKVSESHTSKLRAVARVAQAEPVILSNKASSFPLKKGVIYRRRGVNVIHPKTLKDLVDDNQMVYADRGGHKMYIDSEKLKTARLHFDFTLSNLAEKVGVSTEMVRRYELDEAMPSAPVAQKLVELFGMEIITHPEQTYASLPDTWLSLEFKKMGLEVETPFTPPFDLIARGRELIIGLMGDKISEKKLETLEKFSEFLGAKTLVIGKTLCKLPTIKKEELKNFSEKKLLELVE